MACSYLSRGKVTVTNATPGDGQARRPAEVVAIVEGNSGKYLVTLRDGAWSCTCGRPAECAHAAAVQLVTGWPSLARRQR